KLSRREQLESIRRETIAAILEAHPERWTEGAISEAVEELEAKIVRGGILSGEPRIDGRDPKAIRDIRVEVGVLPRTHGSALFTRGETQALVVTALGSERDAQIIDA